MAALPSALLLAAGRAATVAPPVSDRSPRDLAVTRDGQWAVTANWDSDSASLVDLETGRVTSEAPAGRRPFGVAITPDGRSALVTGWLSNTVTVLRISKGVLRPQASIPVGEEPRGIAISPDGKSACVALAGDDSVCLLDLISLKAVGRIEVGVEPWHVAYTPDGSQIVVGNARSRDVSIIEAAERKVRESVRLMGHNVRHLAVSPDGAWAYVPNIAERGRPATKENIDLGWVVGNRLNRVPLSESGPREAIALDTRGKAVADVDGVAISPDGQTLAVTAAGTHEMLLLRLPLPFISFGGPDDHIDGALLADSRRFRRVPLGGRPLGVVITGDGRRAVTANALLNCLQVVDLESGAVTRTIPLGGPSEPSLARRGESIFYDATRSFNQWYSCGTCHVEGHTNGASFDTFNDGSYETPKKTPSLRGVTKTGPWTWHGWQKSLRQLVHDSMTKSMQGPEPGEADLDAVLAYLSTLDFRPSRPMGEAARRGEAVFRSRACDSCHAPPLYAGDGVYSVGLESPADAYRGFNPPSLRGVGTRSPYLHNGAATTLRQTLTRYHRPSQINGKPDLSADEAADLIAFLKRL